MRYRERLAHLILALAVGVIPPAGGGTVLAEALWPQAELSIKYPRPPKTIDGDPAESSLVLVQFDLKGILRMNGLDGAALVRAGTEGRIVRAGTMKGRLVLFKVTEPGDYSLQFVKVSNGNSMLVLSKMPDVDIDVTIAPGEVRYLGPIVVTMDGMSAHRDAAEEIEAWSTFMKKYPANPWSALVEKRVAALK